MKLTKLLERLEYTCLQGEIDKEISGIVNDSRKVTEGSLFFCIKGAVSDGHTYACGCGPKGRGSYYCSGTGGSARISNRDTGG